MHGPKDLVITRFHCNFLAWFLQDELLYMYEYVTMAEVLFH